MSDEMKQLKRQSLKAGLSSAAVLFITSAHHMYGAVVYSTPWRNHIVLPAILTTLVIASTLFLFSRRPHTVVGQASFWVAVGCILIVPVGIIGIFEGGYNHVLKDVLYFSGVAKPVFQILFPAPTYEMPDNLFFEISGILTFFAALHAAYELYRLINVWRQLHRTNFVS
jgi:hypothetical protein